MTLVALSMMLWEEKSFAFVIILLLTANAPMDPTHIYIYMTVGCGLNQQLMIIVEIMSVKQFSNACLLRDDLLIKFLTD